MSIVMLAIVLTTLSWVSVSKSQLQFFDAPTDSIASKASNASYSKATSIQVFDHYIQSVYEQANLNASGMTPAVFRKALVGYYNFQKSRLVSDVRKVITIIDFSKKSTEKRLWIVDLANNKLLYNTFVAHGNGSGDNIATTFSNKFNSHQSSLGFYITSETYFGKHGLSLKLEGMDKGFNTNARDRAVVIHGADYVSQSFINRNGRLGRSQGCPALPVELTKPIIETIKGQTCLFINGPADSYTSNYLSEELAIENFISNNNSVNASI